MPEQNQGTDWTYLATLLLVGAVGILVLLIGANVSKTNEKVDYLVNKIDVLESHIILLENRTDYIYHVFYKTKLNWEKMDTKYDHIESNVNISNDTLLMFSAPDCSYCIAQENVLKKLSNDTGLKYLRICRADPDNFPAWDACKAAGYFTNNSISLAEKYNVQAIPTLIYKSSERRVGTLAIEDQNVEYNDLKKHFGETQ